MPSDVFSKVCGGRKEDVGKARVDLLPMDALWSVGEVLTFGADKYDPHNWEAGMAWHRLFGATLRHLFKFWSGEDNDPESTLPHLAHACCCVLMLLALWLRNSGQDDRFLKDRRDNVHSGIGGDV